ncbi:hypothetical protein AX16_001636 [Volvariella volvacea WC 439]|nr:hypothetical protein AX16_001636 [Volvariella volvacea WC 439]
MTFMPRQTLLWTVALLLLSTLANGQNTRLRNVTIDDSDPRIVYSPSDQWSLASPTELNVGGNHMLTSTPGAFAVFDFTGVAIYFMSPLWPYRVTTGLQLDAEPPELIELIDRSRPTSEDGGPETVESQVVWSRTGLENGTHTLTIFIAVDEPFAIVDALIYTEVLPSDEDEGDESDDPTSPSTADYSNPSGPQNNSTDNSTPSESGPPLVAIVVPVVIGVLALIGLAAFFYFRRRNRRKESIESNFSAAEGIIAPGGGGGGGRAVGAGGERSGSSGLGPSTQPSPLQMKITPYPPPVLPVSTAPPRLPPLSVPQAPPPGPARGNVNRRSHYGVYSDAINNLVASTAAPALSPGAFSAGIAGTPTRGGHPSYGQWSQYRPENQGRSTIGLSGAGVVNGLAHISTSNLTPTSDTSTSPVVFARPPVLPSLAFAAPPGPWISHNRGRDNGVVVSRNAGGVGASSTEEDIGSLPNPHPSPDPSVELHDQTQHRPPSAAPPAYTEGEGGKGPNKPLGDVKYRIMNPSPVGGAPSSP